MMITITGKIPSKKNSRIIFCQNNKPINIPSQEYREWHRQASLQLKNNKLSTNIESITLAFWFPDKRRRDLDNLAASILDLLVDNHIIVDDCWRITGDLHLLVMGIDKKNPRVRIVIVEEKN